MRFLLLLLGGASSIGIALAATSSSATPPLPTMCRRAPVLEQLPPEPGFDQIAQQGRGGYPERMMAPPPPSPPPPPPTAAPMPERGSPTAEVAVSARRPETGKAMSPPSAMPPPPPPPPAAESVDRSMPMPVPPAHWQQPPAGLLTAGDHDDLLNPRLYARYVWRAARNLGQSIVGLPRVDTSRVLTVEVEDPHGRPAPFVPVTVRCADGSALTFPTLADGRVTFYPDHDALGQQVTLSAGRSTRRVTVDPTAGGQTQTFVLPARAAPVRKLDLMIALDTTGSMGDEIAFLKAELRSILAGIRGDYPGIDVRVGLTNYRDEGDEYVTWTLPLGTGFDAVQRRLDVTRGEGGGDMPEAMDQALHRAAAQPWRPDAVKVMLLVADAPPHDDLQARAFAVAEVARARRIQIVPVASSGVDARAEYFMRSVAALTQSRYIFLTDDSGIGNPHAEPDVDCYVVTRLATSIRRVLASMVSGVRVEPRPHEVIRTVGQYDHGRCVLPKWFDPQQ